MLEIGPIYLLMSWVYMDQLCKCKYGQVEAYNLFTFYKWQRSNVVQSNKIPFRVISTTIIWLCWSNNVSTTLTRSKLALGTFLKSSWIWENSTDDVRNPMTKDLSSLCSAILKMISARCELLPFLSQFLHIFANFLFDILQRCNATFDKY